MRAQREQELRRLAAQLLVQLPLHDFKEARRAVRILDRLVDYVERGVVVLDDQGGVTEIRTQEAPHSVPLRLVVGEGAD